MKREPETKNIPVVFLTGQVREAEKVLGLNLGADDYIGKPFSNLELVARVDAVLRRTQPEPAWLRCSSLRYRRVSSLLTPCQTGASTPEIWEFILASALTVAGKPVDFQPREFDILYALAARPNRTLTREFLLESTSGFGPETTSRTLDTHIKNIRKKLGKKAELIVTVHELGYRFAPV